MEAFWPKLPSNGQLDPQMSERDADARTWTDVELDRQIRAGWDVWSDLLEDLLTTGGMLPSRELADRVVGFFDNGYRRAEDARVEALRRQASSPAIGRCRVTDRSRGIR
jgi:hypothetical protein